MKLWTVKSVPASYECTFNYQYLTSKTCVAMDSNGNVVQLTATASAESDLPADSGEATQATEVPEATGSNETATVPPAAEDGKNN